MSSRATDRWNPRARGMCDNCLTVVFHDQLHKQMQYRGAGLRWDGTLRCRRCLDKPQAQDLTPTLRPDPPPVKNPRPER